MAYLLGLWAMALGVYADRTRLQRRAPWLDRTIAPLTPIIGKLGLASLVLGFFGLLASGWWLLGLLGVPFAPLPMATALLQLFLSGALCLVGIMYGTDEVHEKIDDSRKEQAMLQVRDRLLKVEPGLGRVVALCGLVLVVLALVV